MNSLFVAVAYMPDVVLSSDGGTSCTSLCCRISAARARSIVVAAAFMGTAADHASDHSTDNDKDGDRDTELDPVAGPPFLQQKPAL